MRQPSAPGDSCTSEPSHDPTSQQTAAGSRSCQPTGSTRSGVGPHLAGVAAAVDGRQYLGVQLLAAAVGDGALHDGEVAAVLLRLPRVLVAGVLQGGLPLLPRLCASHQGVTQLHVRRRSRAARHPASVLHEQHAGLKNVWGGRPPERWVALQDRT